MICVYRCDICYSTVELNVKSSSCSFCKSPFHQDHLKAWLLSSDFCPVCRMKFKDDFREDLKPTSNQEEEYLKNILRTISEQKDKQNRSDAVHTQYMSMSNEIQNNPYLSKHAEDFKLAYGQKLDQVGEENSKSKFYNILERLIGGVLLIYGIFYIIAWGST